MTVRSVHRQNGYGAYKRHERCEVCWQKVGTWRAEHDNGTSRYFCDDHVTAAFADRALEQQSAATR